MLTFKVHFMRMCCAIPIIGAQTATTGWVGRKLWLIGSIRLDWRVIEGWILTGDDRTVLISTTHSLNPQRHVVLPGTAGVFLESFRTCLIACLVMLVFRLPHFLHLFSNPCSLLDQPSAGALLVALHKSRHSSFQVTQWPQSPSGMGSAQCHLFCSVGEASIRSAGWNSSFRIKILSWLLCSLH